MTDILISIFAIGTALLLAGMVVYPALFGAPHAKILCYRFCIQGMALDKVNANKTPFLYTLNKGTWVDQFS